MPENPTFDIVPHDTGRNGSLEDVPSGNPLIFPVWTGNIQK
jgi:hypothetical protein